MAGPTIDRALRARIERNASRGGFFKKAADVVAGKGGDAPTPAPLKSGKPIKEITITATEFSKDPKAARARAAAEGAILIVEDDDVNPKTGFKARSGEPGYIAKSREKGFLIPRPYRTLSGKPGLQFNAYYKTRSEGGKRSSSRTLGSIRQKLEREAKKRRRSAAEFNPNPQ